ncbi:MAG TPA: flagellar biosynthetic protein FliO [Verrucomicrobiae bacterium]|nr:flagellar biosynthetic protein FliO [Verrucomicrobiae bacterium]
MKSYLTKTGVLFFALLTAGPAFAQNTNSFATSLASPNLPGAEFSILRVFGALALVIGIFLGGVWLFRNWQRLTIQRGHVPKLNIVETRSLGGRQAIFVVGYEHERFLISSSPTGINLLSHLPQVVEDKTDGAEPKAPVPSFSQTLVQMLKRK